MTHSTSRLARIVFDNSLLLVIGTLAAVVWANLHLTSYDTVAHPLHFWVNDVGMAFFFALATKEVFEATLPGGPLASPGRAASPLAAAVGGMVAPGLIYVSLASILGPPELIRGWAIPGALSWAALYFGGFHPALALVPIVPFMPHSPRDLGLFDPREERQPDTLNRFEHWWATPVQFMLLLFGFANAGVPFAQIGAGTYYVLAALLLGKPMGILLFSGAARLMGGRLPPGLHVGDLLTVGITASIGVPKRLPLLFPWERVRGRPTSRPLYACQMGPGKRAPAMRDGTRAGSIDSSPASTASRRYFERSSFTSASV